MVFDVLSRLKSVWPLKLGVTLDDQWDHCNRSFMFILLCVFGFIVTVRQYTGNIISCTGFKNVEKDFANDFCWTQGLYTILEAYDHPTSDVPYPGIIPEDIPPCIERRLVDGSKIVCPPRSSVLPVTRLYHVWYQWVPFYFWLAALAFYTPYMLLKQLGFGEIKPVIQLLHNPMENEEELGKTVDRASNWLFHHMETYTNPRRRCVSIPLFCQMNRLGVVAIFVKFLYLAVTAATFILTCRMFPYGDFKSYGVNWAKPAFLSLNDSQATLVRHKLFPKMISCEIIKWAESGLDEDNGMCILAPNVINQYLFLILWFALVILLIFNSLSFINALIKYPLVNYAYRRFLLRSFLKHNDDIKCLYKRVGLSGRIILHLLAAHVQPKVFERVLVSLTLKMGIRNKSRFSNGGGEVQQTADSAGKDMRKRNVKSYMETNGGSRNLNRTLLGSPPQIPSSHHNYDEEV